MSKHKLMSKVCCVHGTKDVRVDEKKLTYSDEDVVVKVEHGGICGSDFHYYQNGKNGLSIIKEPLIIGHEFVGKVYKVPADCALKVGQQVAINPSQPCNHCKFCLEGNQNECPNMRFMGSAQFFPHVHGGFAEYIVTKISQCIVYDDKVSSQVMAFAEPLSVSIHAINIAGTLVGKKVLVIGGGPIGCLIAAAAKASGASEVVVSDISERCRNVALEMGVSKAIDPTDKQQFEFYLKEQGYFDVTFEACGAPSAIASTIMLTRPKGIIVQVGNGPSPVEIPINLLLGKELSLKGSFRFGQEFNTAVEWLESGKIDPKPLISSVYPYRDIEKALIAAADKSISSKVLVSFQ